MTKMGYRTVQAGFGLLAHGIGPLVWPSVPERGPWGQRVENHAGAVERIPQALAEDGLQRLLVVTDQGVREAGLLEKVLPQIEAAGVAVTLYADVHANPTIPDIEAGLARYVDGDCEAILAIGGGSPMDCAKMIRALVVMLPHPIETEATSSNLRKLGGLFKVSLYAGMTACRQRGRKLPSLYAVPTTAGTGSETTIAAVVTDPAGHEKYTVMDVLLRPQRVFLDATLTLSLPRSVTAASGMDALTHAVEAYVNGGMATETTRRQAREAAALIFRYLPQAYADGTDLQARARMLEAAFLAGEAFGRATVGYAHAIAHAVGGLSNLPHGTLTGVVLPPLLEWYGEAAVPRLAELADACGLATEEAHLGKLGQAAEVADAGKARAFIRAVYALRRTLGLAETLPPLNEAEQALVCQRAMREANPFYAVPRIMSERQCRSFVRMLCANHEG